ncbi:hypothetical protein ANCCAN_18323 [Ancylostoma caninum]|uniref:G-protein coupled receptors family 1 profile domain-containing protein n=1 Tax=Ancylostoma caninum TaxID=29170 RepID=A0A368FZR9_ANCCA|nr:hypothetical protein ANCCAN_18323 [Ancylostoma caninum]
MKLVFSTLPDSISRRFCTWFLSQVEFVISLMFQMNETIPYDEEDLCGVEITDHRFYMSVAGTVLSFVSLFCNLLIAKVLCSSRHAHFFFLALLAMSDSFLSFMYGPVIALDIIKDRLQILWLTRLYWWYVGPLLSLCQDISP